MKTRSVACVLILCLLLTAGVPARPAQAADLGAGVFLDGVAVSFPDQQPILHSGRILVPLRFVTEALGATPIWIPETRSVSIRQGTRQIHISVGDAFATVDQVKVPLDAPAQLVNRRTMVPLRFVSEALGHTVVWNQAAYAAYIEGSGPARPPSAERALVERNAEHDFSPDGKVQPIPNGSIQLSPDSESGIHRLSAGREDGFQYDITYAARVLPVQVGEYIVQANDIALSPDRAFVAYNKAGPVYAGAVQIIDIRSPSRPRILYELRLRGMNVHAVYYDPDRDLLVFGGGADEKVWGGRSYIASFRASQAASGNDAVLDQMASSLTFLPSYHLTSIAKDHQSGHYYAAVGAEDGQILELDRHFGIVRSREVGDVRDIATREGELFALAGTVDNPATRGRILRSLSETAHDISLVDFRSPEHKAVIEVHPGPGDDSLAYLALSEAGMQVWQLGRPGTAARMVYSLANPPFEHSQTNSVSYADGLAFLANGGYGFRVLRVHGPGNQPFAELLGRHQLVGDLYDQDFSANHVAYQGAHGHSSSESVLFVASGWGGMHVYVLTKTGEDDDDPGELPVIGDRHPGNYVLFHGGTGLTALQLPSGSQLDWNVYSRGDLSVLSANSVIGGHAVAGGHINLGSSSRVDGAVCTFGGHVVLASAGAVVSGPVDAVGDVTVGSGGTISGPVKAGGQVTLQPIGSRVDGDIHAERGVSIGSSATAGRHVFTAGDIELFNTQSSSQGIQGDAHAGGSILRQDQTHIGGASYDGTAPVPPRIRPEAPELRVDSPISPPTLQSVSAGTRDFTVDQGVTVLVPPGSYRDLRINGGSTTILEGGDYVFREIDGANWGQTLRLDLSSGTPLTVRVTGSLRFSGNVEVSTDGLTSVRIRDMDPDTAREFARLVYWEVHGEFTITTNNMVRNWFGTVLAGNRVRLASGFWGVGTFATTETGYFDLGSNPRILYSLADHAARHW